MFIINWFRSAAGSAQCWRISGEKALAVQIKKAEENLQGVSTTNNKVVEIWKGAVNDFHRLGNLEVNGEELYPSPDEPALPDNVMQAKVATQLYIQSGQDELLTRRIAALIHQAMPVQLLIMDRIQRAYTEENQSASSTTERFQSVEVDQKKRTFRLVHEHVLLDRDSDNIQDLSKHTYIKAKAIIQGSTDALKMGSSNSLNSLEVKVIHTKNYKTLEAAKKANYFGIRGILFSPKEWRSRIY